MLIIFLLLAIAFIVISTAKFKLHPFLALIIAAIGYLQWWRHGCSLPNSNRAVRCRNIQDRHVQIALAVTSLCSGVMVVSHANDSFFWVITQMSGMSVKQGYKLHTLGTLICGLTSMMAVWGIYAIFC